MVEENKAYFSKIIYCPNYKVCQKERTRFIDKAEAASRAYLNAECSSAFPYKGMEDNDSFNERLYCFMRRLMGKHRHRNGRFSKNIQAIPYKNIMKNNSAIQTIK